MFLPAAGGGAAGEPPAFPLWPLRDPARPRPRVHVNLFDKESES